MKIIELFNEVASSHIITEHSEDRMSYKVVFECTSVRLLKIEFLNTLLEFPHERDRIVAKVTIGSSTFDFYKENTDDFDSIIEQWVIGIKVAVDIKIIKEQIESCLTIYNLQEFFNDLNNTALKERLQKVKAILNEKEIVNFETFEDVSPFHTSSFFFYSYSETTQKNQNQNNLIRKDIIDKRNKIANFANSSDIEFIPDDFYLSIRSNVPIVNEFFDKLCFYFSIISISDYSIISNNNFEAVINGYKQLKFESQFSTENITNIETIFKLYQWTYQDGNISDKVGLLRNIISLNLNDNNFTDINENILDTVRSNYQIYLKSNIKEYIEIKNKISDQLIELSNKSSKIADDFGSSFKTSIYSVVSFFVTVFVVRALVSDNIRNVLNNNFLWVTIIFSFVSIVYLAFSLVELKSNFRRFKLSYKALKNRYEDILDSKDLDKIFNNDKDFIADKIHIRKRRKVFFVLWIFVLILLWIILFMSIIC